jgi:hypothetical protein
MLPVSSIKFMVEVNFNVEKPLKSNIPPANVQIKAATSSKYRLGMPGL